MAADPLHPAWRARARRRTALLLLAAACSACQSAPEPQVFDFDDPKWEDFLRILPHALGPAHELEKRRAKRGIPLRFRLGAADPEPFRERIENDPHCGAMLEIFARELLPPSSTAVGSEEVLELDAGGEVIERWPVPPDKPVLAVRGDEILATHNVSLPDSRTLAVLLAIRPDGSFRVVSRRNFAAPVLVACPAGEAVQVEGLPERSCRLFPTDDGERLLAQEGACLGLAPWTPPAGDAAGSEPAQETPPVQR